MTKDKITYKDLSGEEYDIYAGLQYEVAPDVTLTLKPATPALCEKVDNIIKPEFISVDEAGIREALKEDFKRRYGYTAGDQYTDEHDEEYAREFEDLLRKAKNESKRREIEIIGAMTARIELAYTGVPADYNWRENVGYDMIGRLESDFLLMASGAGSAQKRISVLSSLRSIVPTQSAPQSQQNGRQNITVMRTPGKEGYTK